MTVDELIKIATLMGLEHDPKRNYDDNEKRGYIVFDGVNAQRFSIDVPNTSDEEIYQRLGEYLQLMGRRQLKVELGTLLNMMSDN